MDLDVGLVKPVLAFLDQHSLLKLLVVELPSASGLAPLQLLRLLIVVFLLADAIEEPLESAPQNEKGSATESEKEESTKASSLIDFWLDDLNPKNETKVEKEKELLQKQKKQIAQVLVGIV